MHSSREVFVRETPGWVSASTQRLSRPEQARRCSRLPLSSRQLRKPVQALDDQIRVELQSECQRLMQKRRCLRGITLHADQCAQEMQQPHQLRTTPLATTPIHLV